MADITKISVNGTSYNIKDSGAIRSHQDISGKANTSGTYSGLNVGYATHAGSTPMLTSSDTRSTNPTPADYMEKGKGVTVEFKDTTAIGISDASTYCTLITIINWSDNSGGRPSQLATGTGRGMMYRNAASDTTWNSWQQVITSSNYTSYCATASHNHSGVYQPAGSYAASNHNHNGVYQPAGSYAASSHNHSTITGSYTADGGQQNPNYFGTNKVGCLMMNTTVNGDSHYKDWLIMDCYSGNDVGGGTAFGIDRQEMKAFIMGSDAARTSWTRSAELLTTNNYTTYCAAKNHTHPGLGSVTLKTWS